MSKDPGYTDPFSTRASAAEDELDELKEKYSEVIESWKNDLKDKVSEIKELNQYINQLEEMLGCTAPKSYCDGCSCGKKEALGD